MISKIVYVIMIPSFQEKSAEEIKKKIIRKTFIWKNSILKL